MASAKEPTERVLNKTQYVCKDADGRLLEFSAALTVDGSQAKAVERFNRHSRGLRLAENMEWRLLAEAGWSVVAAKAVQHRNLSNGWSWPVLVEVGTSNSTRPASGADELDATANQEARSNGAA